MVCPAQIKLSQEHKLRGEGEDPYEDTSVLCETREPGPYPFLRSYAASVAQSSGWQRGDELGIAIAPSPAAKEQRNSAILFLFHLMEDCTIKFCLTKQQLVSGAG